MEGWRRKKSEGALVVGVMSGTSADGVDVALTRIGERGARRSVEVRAFRETPYPLGLRQRIFGLFPTSRARRGTGSRGTAKIGELAEMNFRLGEHFARRILEILERARVSPNEVALIGSHGQTIFHSPPGGGAVPCTLQIGEGAVIAERTGIPTISDFRVADVAAGGTGAPLVPYPDYLLFAHPRRGRIILNIGGIANLTYLPPGGKPEDVIAFDTGPGNMLIDAMVVRATGGKGSYDRGGQMAQSGTVDRGALDWLLAAPFFRRPPPKATGRERFGEPLADELMARFPGLAGADAVATVTRLTVESIAGAIRRFVPPEGPVHEVYVGGGGAKNRTLMDWLAGSLAHHVPGVRIAPTDALDIPAGIREAVAFALLAYETYHGRPGNLPQVTGARHRTVLGKLSLPPPGDAGRRSARGGRR